MCDVIEEDGDEVQVFNHRDVMQLLRRAAPAHLLSWFPGSLIAIRRPPPGRFSPGQVRYCCHALMAADGDTAKATNLNRWHYSAHATEAGQHLDLTITCCNRSARGRVKFN